MVGLKEQIQLFDQSWLQMVTSGLFFQKIKRIEKNNIRPFLAGPLPIRPHVIPNVIPLNGQVRNYIYHIRWGNYIRNCVFARSGIWLSELIGDHWGSQFLGWNGLQSTVVLPEVLLLLQGVHVHGLNERGKKNWFISTSGISSFGLLPKSLAGPLLEFTCQIQK